MFDTYELDTDLYKKCKKKIGFRPNWIAHCCNHLYICIANKIVQKLKEWKPRNGKFSTNILQTYSIEIAQELGSNEVSVSDAAFVNSLLIGFLSGT